MPKPKKSGPQGLHSATSRVTTYHGKKGGFATHSLGHGSKRKITEARGKYYGTKGKQGLARFNSPQFAVRLGRKHSFKPPGCVPGIDLYSYVKDRLPGIRSLSLDETAWFCGDRTAPSLQFRESNHRVLNHDIRLFIEGAEVTQYIRGPVTWKIETTGGMNTCDFSLNNNHDAFIVTPRNICAGLNQRGWRVNLRGKNVISQPGKLNRRDNEGAKFLIYRRKYKVVAPGTKAAEVDDSSGMWLYPLSPYTSIIEKHDAIRLFYRMPHISGVTRVRSKRTNQHWDLWIPAFTGFVNNYNWEDNPVEGDRVMNVSCYDYRGLMERMRVRTGGCPLSSAGGAKKVGSQLVQGNHPSQNVSFPMLLNNGLVNRKEYNKLKQIGALALLSEIYVNQRKLGQIKDCKIRSVSADSRQTECQKRIEAQAKKDLAVVTKTMKTALNKMERPLLISGAATGQAIDVALDSNGRNIIPVPVGKKKKGDIKILEEIQKEIGDGSFNPSAIVDCDTSTVAKKLIDKATGGNGNRKFYSPQVAKILTKLFTIRCGEELFESVEEQIEQHGGKLTNQSIDEIKKDWRDFLRTSPLQEVRNISAEDFAGDIAVAEEDAAWHRFVKQRKPLRKQLTNRVSKLALTLSETSQGFLLGFIFTPGKTKILVITERTVQEMGRAVNSVLLGFRKSQKSKKHLNDLNNAYKRLRIKARQIKSALAAFTKNDAKLLRLSNKLSTVMKEEQNRRAIAKASAPGQKGAGNWAELILNEPTFTTKQAKLFGDLVKDLEANSHPLAGMAFEEAVRWLVTSQSQILLGRKLEVASYNKKGLVEEWNRTVLFGNWGRPLTFDEVTLVGLNTNSDVYENPFSPINAYLHFMLPAKGTAAQTIVQQDVGANPGNAQSFQYETRKSLIDQICELLDYQWYVTPIGDIAFEFPHYNILPVDFGSQFRHAYVVDKELISNNIAEEATDIPTAWVITGMEIDALAEKAVGTRISENLFRKITIMVPTLARRLGVKVDHVKINLPGVGAVLGETGRRGGQLALEMWGMFYIQRQIGLRHQVSVKHAFRPYLLPNRPLHLISRQRIGLIQSVSYSMEPPDGACTTETTLGYMRWLYRDGTFRNSVGGLRFPIDYEGFHSGAKTINLREGVGHSIKVAAGPTTIADDKLGFVDRPKVPSKDQTSYGVKGATTDKSQKSVSRTSSQIGAIAQRSRKVGDKTSGSGGTSAQKGSKLSAGVSPGKTLKTQKPQSTSNLAGRNIQRTPPNKQGRQNVVEMSRTNMTSTGGKNPNKNKKGDGRTDSYDLNKLFYDPTPFGKWTKKKRSLRHSYNQWGFIRYHSPGFNNRSLHGNKWHPGIDILVPLRTKIYTPIDLTNLKTSLTVGQGQGDALGRKSWVTFAIFRLNSSNKVVMNPKDIKHRYIPFIVDPVIRKSLEASVTEKQLGNMKMKATKDDNGNIIRQDVKVEIWTNRYKIAKAHGFRLKANPSKSAAGLWMKGFGYVSIPKGSSDPRFQGDKGKLRCRVRFMHLHSVMKGTKGTKSGYYGVDIRSASADPNQERPIARVGKSGTSVSHLHFELVIFPTGHYKQRTPNAEYLQAFREVLKANAEFLTQVLATKLAGKRMRAKPTDKLSPTWKKRLVRKGVLVVPKSEKASDGKVTIPVDINNLTALQVAKILTKHTFKTKFRDRTDESYLIQRATTGTNQGGTLVNPLFFFKPEQLVDLRKIRPSLYKSRRSSRFQDSGAGRGRETTVVHGICKKLTNTGLQSNFKRHFLRRAELNRTAGTTATLVGQSQSQRRKAFRRNNLEFGATEREFLQTIDGVEDHTYDSRVASRVEFENKINRNSNNRFDEHLKITPTLPGPEDYNMFG